MEHIRSSCKIQPRGQPAVKILGVEIGKEASARQLQAQVENVTKLCASLAAAEDVRAELSLLRASANASRITHLLRAAGPDQRARPC